MGPGQMFWISPYISLAGLPLTGGALNSVLPNKNVRKQKVPASQLVAKMRKNAFVYSRKSLRLFVCECNEIRINRSDICINFWLHLADLLTTLKAEYSLGRLDGYGMYFYGVVLKAVDLNQAAQELLKQSICSAPTFATKSQTSGGLDFNGS